MKNLILVIGRSGSGKDTIVRYAQNVFNACSIPSYTDRPKRDCETDGVEHTFLTEEEFDHLLENEVIFAYTRIGNTGYRYCTTVNMLKNIDSDIVFYTIDPKGWEFCKKFSDELDITVVYVSTDTEKRMERANKRNGDDTSWKKRCEDENEQFDKFEKSHEWDILVENNGSQEDAEKYFVDSIKEILA